MVRSLVHGSTLLSLLTVALLVPAGCDSSSSDGADANPQAGDADPNAPDADPSSSPDADPKAPDATPCTPDASSLMCANATTLSLCTEDTDFDRVKDSPPTTVEISCKEFFGGSGEASCETSGGVPAEVQCTMDDGGPCGVRLINGAGTWARCTTDDSVCLMNQELSNYNCTSGTGVSCTASTEFKPFCSGKYRILDCIEDRDGTAQPTVDDCSRLAGGRCDTETAKCVDIGVGSRCNLTDWLCADGLTCEKNANDSNRTCVAP